MGKKEQKRQKSHGSISHSIPCSGNPGRLRADGSRYCDAKEVEITNVSYDPTRELYEAYNALFADHWKKQIGQDVSVIQ